MPIINETQDVKCGSVIEWSVLVLGNARNPVNNILLVGLSLTKYFLQKIRWTFGFKIREATSFPVNVVPILCGIGFKR